MLKPAVWLIAFVVVCSGLATGEARAESRVDWSEYIETKPTRLTPVGKDRPTVQKRTAKAKVAKKKKRAKARGKRVRRR